MTEAKRKPGRPPLGEVPKVRKSVRIPVEADNFIRDIRELAGPACSYSHALALVLAQASKRQAHEYVYPEGLK